MSGKKKLSVSIQTDTALKGQFRISFEGNGKMDLDMISLFPSDTWRNRPGGMRSDMIQLLADMKPGFNQVSRGMYCGGPRPGNQVPMEENIRTR